MLTPESTSITKGLLMVMIARARERVDVLATDPTDLKLPRPLAKALWNNVRVRVMVKNPMPSSSLNGNVRNLGLPVDDSYYLQKAALLELYMIGKPFEGVSFEMRVFNNRPSQSIETIVRVDNKVVVGSRGTPRGRQRYVGFGLQDSGVKDPFLDTLQQTYDQGTDFRRIDWVIEAQPNKEDESFSSELSEVGYTAEEVQTTREMLLRAIDEPETPQITDTPPDQII